LPMMCKHRCFKAMCWLCIGLAVSTCTYEACLARDVGQDAPADSLGGAVEPSLDEVINAIVNEDTMVVGTDAPVDSVGSGGAKQAQPIYRKWWVWALATTGLAVIAAMGGGGGAKTTEEDLPGFPDPPSR
jgi:hypothetical protein